MTDVTRDTPSGRYSVSFPRRAWYPVCRSRDLGRPHGFTLMDEPLVAFRDRTGRAAVLSDRCPHRNAPLSLGRTRDGCLECGYHGWRFTGEGVCVSIPGLGLVDDTDNRRVAAWATTESDGFAWVWGDPSVDPVGTPLPLPAMTGRHRGEAIFAEDLDCTMHAAIENALDVPHTAFLHAGIFRGREQHELDAVRREIPGGVEVQYLGEPVGMGPLRPGGDATFDHWDRFLLPSIAQIEYAIPRSGSRQPWLRIVNTILHLPLSAHRTRAWFVVRFESPLPSTLGRVIVRARGRRILAQDASMLAAQNANVRRFGGERFTSTSLDAIGAAVWRLLRRAERAESSDGPAPPPADDEPIPEERFTVLV